MAPLKLARLPDRETIKITFTASAEMKSNLEDYAAAYEREYGHNEIPTELIPHMLESFVRNDRGFRRTLNNSGNERANSNQRTQTLNENDG